MSEIKYGNFRVTEIFDTYVLKYPINKFGITQNQEEYQKYLDNKDVYAKCELLEHNILKMEKLEDKSDLVESLLLNEQYTCDLYDNWSEPTMVLNCNKDCEHCSYAKIVESLPQLENLLQYKTDQHIQVGFDKNGILKYYDYADFIPTIEEFSDSFRMQECFKDLFNEWLTSTDKTILFSEWIKNKELNYYSTPEEQIKQYQHINKLRRREYVGLFDK